MRRMISFRSLCFATKAGSRVRALGTTGMPHWDELNQWIDEAPQWSPDSRWISYRTRMSPAERWQVSLWNVTSGLREKRTSVPGDVESYRWCAGGSELFLTVLKPRPSVDTTNAAESGILFNQAIHPYQVIPVLTQVQDAKEPEREYWIYDLKTQRQRRATESEVGKWKPWNSRSASDPNSALAKYHILDAAPSPDGSKVAYSMEWIIQRSRKRGLVGFSCLRITTINFSKSRPMHTGLNNSGGLPTEARCTSLSMMGGDTPRSYGNCGPEI